MDLVKPFVLVVIYITMAKAKLSHSIPMELSSNCSVRQVRMTIKVEDCLPVQIRAKACSGMCPSYTTTSSDKPNALETKCECCQYVGKKRKRFVIRCPHKVQKNTFKLAIASVTIPRKCMCRPCSDAPNRLLSAEQTILRRNPMLDLLRMNALFR